MTRPFFRVVNGEQVKASKRFVFLVKPGMCQYCRCVPLAPPVTDSFLGHGHQRPRSLRMGVVVWDGRLAVEANLHQAEALLNLLAHEV